MLILGEPCEFLSLPGLVFVTHTHGFVESELVNQASVGCGECIG
jgi:hypothetical protein